MVLPSPATPALRSEVLRENCLWEHILLTADSLTICTIYTVGTVLSSPPKTSWNLPTSELSALPHSVPLRGWTWPPLHEDAQGCFHYFAVVNNATMNNLVPLPFHTRVGLFAG